MQVYNIDTMQGFKSYSELKAIDAPYRSSHNKSINTKYPNIFNLWQGGKSKSNVFEYRKDYDGYHTTQKPVLLLEDLIKTFSNTGDLVVDLTMGSGSTGVACVNTDRDFTGIELNETYFNTAYKRVEAAKLAISNSSN